MGGVTTTGCPRCTWRGERVRIARHTTAATRKRNARYCDRCIRTQDGVMIAVLLSSPPDGTPHPAPIAWDEQPLGQVTDKELAGRLGVSLSAVQRARAWRGIPRFQGHPRIDWDKQPLGRVSDAELARRLGVTQQAAFRARRKRGIGPWKGEGVEET